MKIRIKAQNPSGSVEYYQEPYTVQHFTDWAKDMVWGRESLAWYAIRYYTSKKFRVETARAYNSAMFGNIPTSQIFVPGEDGQYRPMREDERTWPE